jgi:hypothetical protein
MKVGIYRQHLGGLHKGYLEKYAEILQHNGIEYIWLDASFPKFWEDVSRLDLFIYQWEHYDGPRQIAEAIMPIIENELKIKCFPNWKTSWHFDDKIKQYYLLRQHDFPIIDCYIFWEKNEALSWLQSADLPVVFKLKRGAGSSNVVLVKNMQQARRLISKMFGKGLKSGRIVDRNSLWLKYFQPHRELRRIGDIFLKKVGREFKPLFWQIEKNYALFQKYLPDNAFDTRVSVIGERAFAFRRFNRDRDFRASGSGKINYDTSGIDIRAVEIAFKISKTLGFQSMSYDFLKNQTGNLEICEISYTYVDSAVYNCTGFWDQDLNWHEGHFWPQYVALADALKMPRLKQPTLRI